MWTSALTPGPAREAPCKRHRSFPMSNTNAVGPEVQRFVLSSLPPSQAHKQQALVVLLGILVVVLIVAGPLSHVRTSPVPAFIPIYVTTMIATDSLTAILLFTQFVILRS